MKYAWKRFQRKEVKPEFAQFVNIFRVKEVVLNFLLFVHDKQNPVMMTLLIYISSLSLSFYQYYRTLNAYIDCHKKEK
jgi:hypothetical protein